MTHLSAIHEVGSSVSVCDGALELFRYVYAPQHPQLESPRPYLHPIRTRQGNLISLYRPHDHVWHKGIAWSLPVVENENFWGGGSYVHGKGYVDLPNNGAQRVTGPVAVSAGDDVTIAHDVDWITQSGERWFTERRTLTAAITSGDAWVLTFDTTMTNVRGAEISIGSPTTRGRENAGYGGLFWRGPRSFTGGTLVAPQAEGGDELRGQRHEWMAFVGKHDGVDGSSILLMLDDEANLQHPPQWFARSEEFAALNPAQFFSEEALVPPGGRLRLRYGVGIADGSVADVAALADAVREKVRARS
jgi:hypothetical protein